MHYKNGRPANNGDHVITKDYAGRISTGVIYNLRPGETCNCDVAVLRPGGSDTLTCQAVGQMYSAADAFGLIDAADGLVEKLQGAEQQTSYPYPSD